MAASGESIADRLSLLATEASFVAAQASGATILLSIFVQHFSASPRISGVPRVRLRRPLLSCFKPASSFERETLDESKHGIGERIYAIKILGSNPLSNLQDRRCAPAEGAEYRGC